MLISLKKEIALLANPKCGTTSIEEAMRYKFDIKIGGSPGLKHLNAGAFEKSWKPFLESQLGIKNLFTICTTREPTSKIISWYKYRSRPKLKGKKRYLGDTPFREFCAQQMQLQADAFFFDADAKRPLVDIAVPVESIEILENFLSKEFSTVTVPHKNSSKEVHPTSLAAGMNAYSYKEVIEEELKKASIIFIESTQRSKLIYDLFSKTSKSDDLRKVSLLFKDIFT